MVTVAEHILFENARVRKLTSKGIENPVMANISFEISNWTGRYNFWVQNGRRYNLLKGAYATRDYNEDVKGLAVDYLYSKEFGEHSIVITPDEGFRLQSGDPVYEKLCLISDVVRRQSEKSRSWVSDAELTTYHFGGEAAIA